MCNDIYFYDYFGKEFNENIIGKSIQESLIKINTEQEFIKYLSTIDELEIITEIILNVPEFIFYEKYSLSRGIHLVNLLEDYVLSNKKYFDNVIVLKNNFLKNKENDNFELNKLKMRNPISIKLMIAVYENRGLEEKLLEKYISRTIEKYDSILDYIFYLKKYIKNYDEIYYLERIYGVKKGKDSSKYIRFYFNNGS